MSDSNDLINIRRDNTLSKFLILHIKYSLAYFRLCIVPIGLYVVSLYGFISKKECFKNVTVLYRKAEAQTQR